MEGGKITHGKEKNTNEQGKGSVRHIGTKVKHAGAAPKRGRTTP
jgi:hypothetical protein